MKNSLLMQQCRLIYKRIQQDIQSHESQIPDEIKYIEWGFGATLQAWLNIEKITNSYSFRDRQEEVYFYKSQHPRFAGLIDYFNLVYKSILFQPEDYTKWEDYWKRELHTCMDSIARFTIACLTYQQQQPDIDIYFLQHNNQQALLFGSNVTTFDFQRTSYSSLLGRLIALKKHKKYIQEKICIRASLRQIA
jgi:hypothetical protein